MTALYVHAALGLFFLVLFLYFNAELYRAGWRGSQVSALEGLYYVIALASVAVGWYFNTQYVQTFGAQASWVHFTRLLFTNPAAASGAQDLITANVLLFPLWTIVDGRRSGMRQPWIYFVLSLLTSFGFAMGLYLAVHERQVRWLRARAAN
jgi:hypothetical protein